MDPAKNVIHRRCFICQKDYQQFTEGTVYLISIESMVHLSFSMNCKKRGSLSCLVALPVISLKFMSETDSVQTQQLRGARRACSEKENILFGQHVIDNGSVAQGASGTEDEVGTVNCALHGFSAVFYSDPVADLSDICRIEVQHTDLITARAQHFQNGRLVAHQSDFYRIGTVFSKPFFHLL